MHELPLVFFTVLSQSAVGAFIILLVSSRVSPVGERQFTLALMGPLTVLGLGLIASIFHLGQPMRALNTLLGLGRSPMSAEIVLIGAFSLFAGLTFLTRLFGIGCEKLHLGLAVIASLFGLAFVVFVPCVYQLPTVPAWDTPLTMAAMILTAFIGGGMLAALFGANRLGLAIGGLAIIVSFVVHSAFNGGLWPSSFWMNFQMIAIALALVSSVLAMAYRPDSKMLIVVCCVLAIVGELAGRIAFYDMWSIAL